MKDFPEFDGRHWIRSEAKGSTSLDTYRLLPAVPWEFDIPLRRRLQIGMGYFESLSTPKPCRHESNT